MKNNAMKKFILAIAIALGFQQAAIAGFAEGATAYNNKNYAVALREIAPLANAGNAEAQHLLGLMYYMGRGVQQDYKTAPCARSKSRSRRHARCVLQPCERRCPS
jgi:TPR repeat protein